MGSTVGVKRLEYSSWLHTFLLLCGGGGVHNLLHQGVSSDIRFQNCTPILAACEKGYYAIAFLLVETRADTLAAVYRKGPCVQGGPASIVVHRFIHF